MAAWISSALLKQTWKSSLSHQLWFGKTCTERGFGICVNIVKLSWSRKEELAGFPKRIQRSRGSGLVLVHLNLHANFRLQPALRVKSFYPAQGVDSGLCHWKQAEKRIFLCSFHTLLFLIKRTCLSSLEASWLLVGIGMGILSITFIMCVHLQPVSTSLP